MSKKVYNSLLKSVYGRVPYSRSQTTSRQQHLDVHNFTDKADLRRGDKRVALSGLSIYYTLKNIKKVLQK